MKVLAYFLPVLLALHVVAAEPENHQDDVPVAPIAATGFEGWSNAVRLANGQLDVVVVPETGRIAYLALAGHDNFFRLDRSLTGQSAHPDAPDYWFNFGGDWLWPSAQNRWPDFQGEDWPPSRLLDGRPWKARAWKEADGSLCCMLTQTYGEPLNLEVSRFVKLDKEEARLEIRQEMERTAPSTVPVTLWTISQVAGVEQVVMPVDADSAFPEGYQVLHFSPPEAETLVAGDESMVYVARPGKEHKLGSDSARGWIAAQRGDLLLIEQALPHDPEATYPDGGCTVELYSNTGLGYSEIETLSPEVVLKEGESLKNTLHLSCYQLPRELGPKELAAKVRQLLGESEAPAAP